MFLQCIFYCRGSGCQSCRNSNICQHAGTTFFKKNGCCCCCCCCCVACLFVCFCLMLLLLFDFACFCLMLFLLFLCIVVCYWLFFAMSSVCVRSYTSIVMTCSFFFNFSRLFVFVFTTIKKNQFNTFICFLGE